MKAKNPLSLIFLSWLVSALTIVGIAFIISPDSYVDGFWYRVAWTEFLNVLFWLGNSGWFIENKSNSGMAVTPSISFLTSLYCIISFVLVCVFYKEEALYGLNKSHAVIQIALFGIYLLLMLRFQLAIHFADKDLILSPDACISPLDLSQKIKIVEKDYSAEISKELKKLREKIAYSLQDNNRIRTNKQYKEFVNKLTNSLTKGDMSIKEIKTFVVSVENLAHITKRD